MDHRRGHHSLRSPHYLRPSRSDASTTPSSSRFNSFSETFPLPGLLLLFAQLILPLPTRDFPLFFPWFYFLASLPASFGYRERFVCYYLFPHVAEGEDPPFLAQRNLCNFMKFFVSYHERAEWSVRGDLFVLFPKRAVQFFLSTCTRERERERERGGTGGEQEKRKTKLRVFLITLTLHSHRCHHHINITTTTGYVWSLSVSSSHPTISRSFIVL